MTGTRVPVSASSVARLFSDGTTEREDLSSSVLQGGVAAVVVNGFPGIGIKNANGVLRSAITFAADGGIVLSIFNDDGSLAVDAGLSFASPEGFFLGSGGVLSFPGSSSLRLPAISDGAALPTSDPSVVGQLWNNNGVLNVSAGA